MSEHDTSMDQDSIAARNSSFVPRSDDEASLWGVHEITQESDTQYKVRWVGTDPQTGKPWAQSWVPKADCTDDLILKWEAKRKPSRHNGSVVGQPLPNPKQKRQLEEDVMEPTEVLDNASMKTQKAKPSKKQKQEVDEEDAPINVALFNTRSSLKVGPPRGVHKRHPTHSQPFSSGPALRSSGGGAKATDKTEEAPANRPSEQKLSIPERQPLCLPESSDAEGTSPIWGTVTTSGKPGPSKKALGEYKVQFTSIAANILTLHGLVKKVDVQLETAMRELRELEISWQ